MLSRKILLDFASAFHGRKMFQMHPEALNSEVYPLDLEFTLRDEAYYYHPKDENNLPVRKYQSVGKQYNPTRMAAFGLAHYNRFKATAQEESRDIFLKVADWFLQADRGLWQYHFPWIGLKPPWISCMAQGEGISILTRAYRLTQKETYLHQATLALQPLTQPIEHGGVQSRLSNKFLFLEEYPLPKSPPHTLNGFLYALIGIDDYCGLVKDYTIVSLFQELSTTLEINWKLWDLSYWSAYDLFKTSRGRRNFATSHYHSLHIAQMQFLGEKNKSISLTSCANLWKAYFQNPINRLKALFEKIKYRIEDPAER